MITNPAIPLPRIQVSQNQRFFVTERSDPFFWLGDTAWELFHRLRSEQAQQYYADRQAKRFTVIQAVLLAEFDGLNTPNAYGECPLIDNNPEQPNEAYFAYVDRLITLAAAHDLYIGLLPTWGDKVTPLWGVGPAIFTEANALAYGRYLGERYANNTNIIWILGGDRPAYTQDADFRPIWHALATGILTGTSNRALLTYHPMGGYSSSAWLHDENWLNFNMMQSGHGGGHDVPVWDMIEKDYQRYPTKPVLDGEPNYEDHPVSPWPAWNPDNGYYSDYDVRKQIYRSIFAGGCGVTYGHHSIWQFYEAGRVPVNHPMIDWFQALDRPGARQLKYLRALIESHDFLTRIPDQDLLSSDPGRGSLHIQATRDSRGKYALVYLPSTVTVSVRLSKLTGPAIIASWYDPRTGVTIPIDTYTPDAPVTFTPPENGPDWVLVLESN